MIHIYDGNNFLRRVYEFDKTGLPLRNLYNDMLVGHATDTYIWVFDGYHSKAPRQAILPEYKADRKPKPEGFLEVRKVFKEILKYVPAIQIEVPETEADDVIATIIDQIDKPLTLHSNDSDFLVFKDRPHVTYDRDDFDCPPNLIRLYKTICGDRKDGIPGIPNMGAKRFASLPHDLWLKAFTTQEPVVYEQLGLTPKKLEWASENWDLLKKYWQILGFIKVSDYKIKKGTVVGTNKPQSAEILLQAVMQ